MSRSNSALGLSMFLAALLGGTTGCYTSSNYANADITGTTLSVEPTVLLVSQGSVATVTVRRHSGQPITGVSVSLQADTCVVTPASAPVSAQGTVSFAIAQCQVGTHNVAATLGYHDFSARLPVAAVLSVYDSFAGPAARLLLQVNSQAVAGSTSIATVTALDGNGLVATQYTGSIQLTTSDTQATLPPVLASSGGTLQMPVKWVTAGEQTLQATDVEDPALTTGIADVRVVAAAATSLDLGAPSSVSAGQAWTLDVTARDPFSNIAMAYDGPVVITCDDPQVSVLGFTTLEGGYGTLAGAVLKTAQTTHIMAQDTQQTLTVGQATITVTPGAPQLEFVQQPCCGQTGLALSQQPIVRIVDNFNNFISGGPDSSTTVSLSLTSGAGALLGTTQIPAVGGIASFSSVGVTVQGSVDVISAQATLTSGAALATSLPFAVTLGPATGITWDVDLAHVAQYSFDPNLLNFLASNAELTAGSIDDTSTQWNAGTGQGVAWDTSNQILRLSNSGSCDATQTNCSHLDASWGPQWNNITGYWSFDTNTLSVPANAINADAGVNLVWTSTCTQPGSGKVNQSLYCFANCSGSTPIFQLPANVPTGGAMTFAAWVRWLGGNPNQRVFDFGASATQYMYLTPSGPTGAPRFAITTGGGPTEMSATAVAPLSPGSWAHLAVTLDGNHATLFVNGIAEASSSVALTPLSVAGGNNYIGSSRLSTTPALAAYLDEVLLWNTALTPAEVALIYSRQAAEYAGTYTSRILGPQTGQAAWTDLSWVSTLPSLKALPSNGASENPNAYASLATSALMNDIVFLWHFDETSPGSVAGGFDVYDDSGQGANGSALGSVSFGQFGLFNSALGFDGSTAVMVCQTQYTNPQIFTASVWFKSRTQRGGKLIGFGNRKTGTSNTDDRHIYMDNAGHLILGIYANQGSYENQIVTIASERVYNDGAWHQAVSTYGSGIMALYVDGQLVAEPLYAGTAQSYGGYWRIGGDTLYTWPESPTSYYFQGSLDEVAVWGRALSGAEIFQLWRRGANRSKFQWRACTRADCSDAPGWLGPDGTSESYFSELNNTSVPASASGTVLPTAPDMVFSSFAPLLPPVANAYLQYRAVLESDDNAGLCNYGGSNASACSPEMTRVSVGPAQYPATSAQLSSLTGVGLHNISSVADTYGAEGCSGGVTFTLALNGGPFYFWNGSAWAPADGTVAQSNTPAQLTPTVLESYAAQVGTGTVTFQAFLSTSGASACSLASVSMAGNQ